MNLENGQSLDRILESAVIVSWPDLMKDAKSGLVNLEYALALDKSVNYLKVWSSPVRGHWRLACEYQMQPSGFHDQSVHFEDGFRSDGLSQTLVFIMQHQEFFSPSPNIGRANLLQIQIPTEAETTAAGKLLSDAFCRIDSFRAEPSVAGVF